jgi:1-hydroxycarotenoid 3,4-desaturase
LAENFARSIIDGHEGIDSGPTVFTMRWVFDDLFDSLGLNFEDHVRLERLDLLARHGWSGAARLDLFADLDRTVDAIGAFAGAANANGYRSFCKTAARTFNTLDRTFMRASRPNPLSLTGRIARENIAGLAAIHPFQTLWSALSKSFSDPRLRQLFGRYATYTGGSPFLAPATLMLIAHAERQGVWLVDGGMRQLAVAFANLAEAAGAVVQCGDSVVSLRSGREGKPEITLASGERLTADAVVFNGDINALTTAMLDGTDAAAMNRHQIAAKDRSQSAITFSAIASTAADDLAPHTVAFSDDYAREFDDVFVRHHPPNAPTVYIHAPDRPAAGGVPAGGGFVDGERVFLLVNAPANGGSRYGATEIAETQAAMNATLERSGFPLKLDPIRTTVTTPDDFARLFPGNRRRALRRGTARLAILVQAPWQPNTVASGLLRGRERPSRSRRSDGDDVRTARRRGRSGRPWLIARIDCRHDPKCGRETKNGTTLDEVVPPIVVLHSAEETLTRLAQAGWLPGSCFPCRA